MAPRAGPGCGMRSPTLFGQGLVQHHFDVRLVRNTLALRDGASLFQVISRNAKAYWNIHESGRFNRFVCATVDRLILSLDQRSQLQRWVAGLGTPQQVALRCRMILAVAAGKTEVAIAAENGVTVRL